MRTPSVPGGFYHFTHHKRWQYLALTTPRYFCAAAVVNLGYAANAFVFVADLAEKKTLLQKSFIGVPGLSAQVSGRPAVGALARFRAPGASLELSRPDAASPYKLSVRLRKRLTLDATVSAAGTTPLTYLGPIGGGGRANCTQKLPAAPAEVSLELDGRRLDMAGAQGGMDFTDGLLARDTSWRWAFGQGFARDGTRVAFNLVEGFNEVAGGSSEDAVWIDGVPGSVGRGRFEYDAAEHLKPWKVRSECGAVALTFTPAAGYRECHNLLVASSRFLQVAGLYSGTLQVGGRTYELDGLPGVTEDQSVRW